ncbi:MAG TPA: RNA-binding protein [Clostridiales bacterium]|nr:RNA-binding protein [Clostridiales bacterium]
MDFQPGDAVLSKAGRDKGKVFVILAVREPDYIALADGDLRKIENPKLKKVKHVRHTGIQLPSIVEMINAGERISNSAIRKALDIVRKNGVT